MLRIRLGSSTALPAKLAPVKLAPPLIKARAPSPLVGEGVARSATDEGGRAQRGGSVRSWRTPIARRAATIASVRNATSEEEALKKGIALRAIPLIRRPSADTFPRKGGRGAPCNLLDASHRRGL